MCFVVTKMITLCAYLKVTSKDNTKNNVKHCVAFDIGDDDKEDEQLETSRIEGGRRSNKDESKKVHSKSTIAVTGGALTFILIAATMVTTSFLMSPVIEQMFGEFINKLII